MRTIDSALLSSVLGALLAGPLVAGETTAPPDDCRFDTEGPTGGSATMACYAALDSNGDGALSKVEAGALPRVHGQFEILDADDSGALSPDEFQAGRHTPAQRGGAKGV